MFNFTEELKEAIARSKGKGHFVFGIVDGEYVVLPYCFDIVKQTKNRIVLQIRKPDVPSEEKKKLVSKVISEIEATLKESIADAVRASLLEKPLHELVALSEAKDIKVQRRRGCLWLITDKTEHVI